MLQQDWENARSAKVHVTMDAPSFQRVDTTQ